MRTSQRLQKVRPSLTLEMDAKAKGLIAAGRDVVSLAAGEPDLPPPEPVRAAGERAIREGLGRYTAVAGLPQLREAVTERFRSDWGLSYDAKEIVVSSGAKQSLLNALYVLCDAGDQVLIPTPYWTSYPEMANSLGIEPVFYPITQDGHVDIGALGEAVTPATRAIIINSPANPTGLVLGEKTLKAIAQFAEQHDLWIISDDIYAQLVFDSNHRFFNAPMISPRMRERTVVVYGLSKTYGMTGWRIGFAAAPEEIARQMVTFQGHATSCANAIAQHAGVAALTEVDKGYFASMRDVYRSRATVLTEGFRGIDGVTCQAPVATFYAFPDISALLGRHHKGRPLRTAMEFADALLESELVAVVPGEAFGDPQHIRLSFAASEETLREGVQRIARFVSRLERPSAGEGRETGLGFHPRER